MSFFIFADFLKKVFSHVSDISGIIAPRCRRQIPPPPSPDQAEKPEDQQSPETLENTGENANLYWQTTLNSLQ